MREPASRQLAEPVAALLDHFHARKPVRAWSLIITLYGDSIVPRGGSLWLGSLTQIMTLFRIDPGHVRTAMSRLTSDGWLERERVGRNSYYRLSSREAGSFAAAARRIYFPEAPPFDGELRLALVGPAVDRRSAVRPLLERAGFVVVSPTSYVAIQDACPEVAALDGVFMLRVEASGTARCLAGAAWKLQPVADEYRAFIDLFTPLDDFIGSTANARPLNEADALVVRTLLIHQFRRVVLRDPDLPRALLPSDWPGHRARALAARIHHQVTAQAEIFLSAYGQNENGPLPRRTDEPLRRTGVEGQAFDRRGHRGALPLLPNSRPARFRGSQFRAADSKGFES